LDSISPSCSTVSLSVVCFIEGPPFRSEDWHSTRRQGRYNVREMFLRPKGGKTISAGPAAAADAFCAVSGTHWWSRLSRYGHTLAAPVSLRVCKGRESCLRKSTSEVLATSVFDGSNPFPILWRRFIFPGFDAKAAPVQRLSKVYLGQNSAA
jgi:hypothetical protein